MLFLENFYIFVNEKFCQIIGVLFGPAEACTYPKSGKVALPLGLSPEVKVTYT